jgi:hypothetical protein
VGGTRLIVDAAGGHDRRTSENIGIRRLHGNKRRRLGAGDGFFIAEERDRRQGERAPFDAHSGSLQTGCEYRMMYTRRLRSGRDLT